MASDKQKVWLAEYYKCFNATEAARRADYSSPGKQGQELKAKFADEIKAHLAELTMEADEILFRYAEQARGDLGEFADVSLFDDLKNHPKSHLVKQLVTEVFEDRNGKVHHKMRFELYDAQAAMKAIRDMRGFDAAERVEHSGPGGGPIPIKEIRVNEPVDNSE